MKKHVVLALGLCKNRSMLGQQNRTILGQF